MVLVGVAVILIAAKLGGELLERLGQPAVLGELISGIVIGNLEARLGHIFIGATLCATSVGITARVFKDLGKLATREARIILGAAVIDDVMGLLILAVVAGAIKATATGAALSMIEVGVIAGKALLFLVGSIVLGHFVVPHLLRGAGQLETRGALLTLAISFCFLLAWAASKVGLAPIVGAFAAGLISLRTGLRPCFDQHVSNTLTEQVADFAAYYAVS